MQDQAGDVQGGVFHTGVKLTRRCGFNSGARADRQAIARSDFAREYARICGRTVTFVVSIISLRAMVLPNAGGREREEKVSARPIVDEKAITIFQIIGCRYP
jgi:hypothetical protein